MISFERLRDIREDNDLNQEDMANILHVSRSAYSLWEIGINIIPLKNLYDFAIYFNCNLDYILGLSNERKSNILTKELDLKILGNNLKKIRKQNNLTQKDMSLILNVTQACITRYEKGLVQISISNLYKISKKFNISLDKLCTEEIRVNTVNV